MGISFIQSGSFKKAENLLSFFSKHDYVKIMHKYGKMGVKALQEATPKRTGVTAASWNYEIVKEKHGYSLYFTNSNMAREAIPIALLIQFGHATRSGYYVQGIDYINPALAPVFDRLAKDAWEEVKHA